MLLTKHLKLLSPKSPSLRVLSLARVRPFTVALLSVSRALPTMQGSFGNTLVDRSRGEQVCKSIRHKGATFSKSRECATHSKKQRQTPLTVSLSDFKTARWETSQLHGSLVDDGQPSRWKKERHFYFGCTPRGILVLQPKIGPVPAAWNSFFVVVVVDVNQF